MTQETALSILKTGAHAFLTGAPGSGKTYTLNRYIEHLEACGVPVAVTASTGIAATHIGGMTIHSWSGIGIKRELSERDLDDLVSRESAAKRVQKAKVLVIDEISMLDGRVLDTIDIALRAIRNRPEPFGGLQVIFVGDFYQLPPITQAGQEPRFAFESDAWRAADPLVCYLEEQHRQDDEVLLSILSAIRAGEEEPAAFEPLAERLNAILAVSVEPTRLYTHNVDVDRINAERLAAVPGASRISYMTAKGRRSLFDALKKHCLSPEELALKEGAAVMFTKNNFDAGYVNGTLGTVVGFEGFERHPIVETAGGKRLTVAPVDWSIEENGKALATVTQVPLRLAWAITIHKSQGMTLDAAIVDLSRAFEFGQGYVALSRVRSLSGLSLSGISPRALAVHPKVVEYDTELHALSDAAAASFAALPADELARMHNRFITASCGSLRPSSARAARKKTSARIASPAALTVAQIREGMSLTAIARDRGITPATVLAHIAKAAEAKMFSAADRERLLACADMTDHDALRIGSAFSSLATERLKPVFEHFKGAYPYEAIHVARALLSIDAQVQQ